ncbi:hypothetical protein [Actinomycetospora aeridis]|uniref:Uncharacterized protein n=1 Tax=Actinomycetospora aeridis TaxID=3129231 RepID=A0ABU8N168_9PSEU
MDGLEFSGINRIQRRIGGTFLCLVGVGTTFVCAQYFYWFLFVPYSEQENYLLDCLTFFGSGIGMITGARFFDRGLTWRKVARSRAPTTVGGLSSLTDSEFVLYLRPFRQDPIASTSEDVPMRYFSPFYLERFLITGKSQEEQLVDALAPLGPVIAVAPPGGVDEGLPGAHRLSLDPNADWRRLVEKLIRNARFVVVSAGQSEGAVWETVACLRLVEPERLAILVSQDSGEYETVRAMIGVSLKGQGQLADEDVKDLPPFKAGGDPKSFFHSLIFVPGLGEPVFQPPNFGTSFPATAQARTFLTLESAFRPLFRRLVDLEFKNFGKNGVQTKTEEKPNWFLLWAGGVGPPMVFVSFFSVLGYVLSVLSYGWRVDYSLGAILASGAIGLIGSIAVRNRLYPPPSSPPIVMYVAILFSLAQIYLIALPLLTPSLPRVHWVLVPVLLLVLNYMAFALSSAEAFFDYAIAGTLGIFFGLLYEKVLEAINPGSDYIKFHGIAISAVLAVAVGVYLQRRRTGDRLIDRVGSTGAALASLIGVLLYQLYLGNSIRFLGFAQTATVLRGPTYVDGQLLFIAVAFLVACAGRLVVGWLPLDRWQKISLLVLGAGLLPLML